MATTTDTKALTKRHAIPTVRTFAAIAAPTGHAQCVLAANAVICECGEIVTDRRALAKHHADVELAKALNAWLDATIGSAANDGAFQSPSYHAALDSETDGAK